jgi:hypothetical protein
VDPSRGTPLLVHAGDGKQAFWAEGPVDCEVDDRAMREIGEIQAPDHPQRDTCSDVDSVIGSGAGRGW